MEQSIVIATCSRARVDAPPPLIPVDVQRGDNSINYSIIDILRNYRPRAAQSLLPPTAEVQEKWAVSGHSDGLNGSPTAATT